MDSKHFEMILTIKHGRIWEIFHTLVSLYVGVCVYIEKRIPQTCKVENMLKLEFVLNKQAELRRVLTAVVLDR